MRPPASSGEATSEGNNLLNEHPRHPPLPPSPALARGRRRMPSTSISGHESEVHTVHVHVPVAMAAPPPSINMSVRLNISTTTTTTATTATTGVTTATTPAAGRPNNTSNNANKPGPEAVVVVPPPPLVSGGHVASSPRVAGRVKRSSKGIAYARKSSSRDLDSDERLGASPSPQAAAAAVMASGPVSTRPSPSPFEKLNTLKMLLDGGHLTPEEYHERKTQIINDMTGTSTDRKKPSPRRVQLQPIMKTVVPHNPPDFSRIPKERAEKLSFDVDTLDWQAASTRIQLDLVPFATGQLRNAYFLQELALDNSTHLAVAKFNIRPSDPSSYLSDVEMQAVCAHYAELYNEHEPPLKVYYARSWLLKLKDRGELVCSVEEYLPGAYVKYSNNNGYVGKETSTTEERERNTPHAFSHFTFVASDYRLMIVDIQGVQDSYTDPQIHTADGRGFGAGNLGTFGMEKFLETHRCNEVCRWLGLKSINKEYKPGGTAAPEYQMPFGEKIKKSTNRITEERNTFSRSVTVSEAFSGVPSGLHDEESFSSSVETSATGSSSLLYGQPIMQPFLPSMDSKLPLDARPQMHRLSPHARRGKAMLGGHLRDGEPSMLSLFAKRLLCCCC